MYAAVHVIFQKCLCKLISPLNGTASYCFFWAWVSSYCWSLDSAVRTMAHWRDPVRIESVSTNPSQTQDRQSISLDWASLEATGLGITPPQDLGPSYKLTGLYGIKDEGGIIVSINTIYANAAEKKLIMLQQTKPVTNLQVVVPTDRFIRQINLNGITAYIYRANGQGGNATSEAMIGITWSNSDSHVSITGNVSEEELTGFAKLVSKPIKSDQ